MTGSAASGSSNVGALIFRIGFWEFLVIITVSYAPKPCPALIILVKASIVVVVVLVVVVVVVVVVVE